MAAQYKLGPSDDAICCSPVRPRQILIDALSLTHGGGGHSYLVNLLRELDRDAHGFEFTVLTDSDRLGGTESPWIHYERVRLPSLRNPLRVPMRVAFEQLVLPWRARRFDLLYCPADLAPAFASTPTVVALRNMHIYDQRFYGTLRLRLLQRLVQLGVRRASRILFPTRAAAEIISAEIPVPAERIRIVPHGIAPESFERPSAQPPSGKPYLFLPASIERHKQIDVLIRSLVHSEDPQLEVWIAGSETIDPACAADLRRLAEELGVASRVRFLGPVPYSAILHYYRGALALAFTSRLETFGHPMLEAMLAETSILAADIPAFREIAGDIAVYFPPEDPAALARAADRLRRDREAARARIARGRARALEFSWKRSIDRLCQVFDEVLAEGHIRAAA